jgi:acetyl-CoA carboxylase carboxyltransferase component
VAEPQVFDAEPASAPATLEPLLDGMATAAGTTAARSAPGQGVVRTLPQVVLRRCRTLLDCGGWRTSTDAEATAEGIDIFAEREGRVVGLRVIAGDDRATPETVAVAAHAGTMFGTDLVALVAQGGFDRSTRAAATHAGVVLLEDGDLADLATFLPASAHDRGGPGQRAAAE